jgi:hypothetical protein
MSPKNYNYPEKSTIHVQDFKAKLLQGTVTMATWKLTYIYTSVIWYEDLSQQVTKWA